MDTFDELIKFKAKYIKLENEKRVRKYIAFMKYVEKTILFILKRDEKAIISFLKNLPSTLTNNMTVRWEKEYEYRGYFISIDKNGELYISKFYFIDERHHLSAPMKFIENEPADKILKFGNHEFTAYFNRYGMYASRSDSIIYSIINSFNKSLFLTFEELFESIGINEQTFSSSNYALQMPDKKTCEELGKTISNWYSEYLSIEEKCESDFENCRRTITYNN